MLTTNLTGNLGNHMWYYALCRLVAEKKGFEWGVNPVATHDYFGGQSQMYFMDIDYGKEVVVNGKNERGLNTYVGVINEYYDTPREHIHNGDSCLINMYDPCVFDIQDNTMIHLISQSEDYLIDRKEDIIKWFTLKQEYVNIYEKKLSELGIVLDENTCVINFRGGEYRGVQNLICRHEYWRDSINHMKNLNSGMKFVIVTDDANCAKYYIGDLPCVHDEIGFDFYTINQSKYSIISNSSFGWWASWLNKNSKLIIAPKYWAKHNSSDGFWSLGDQYTRSFVYMGRDGILYNYESCKLESEKFYKKNIN